MKTLKELRWLSVVILKVKVDVVDPVYRWKFEKVE